MIIRRIQLENIRSYKTLDLVLPNGAILLAGDIGAGKTTILLAIEFALFGLQPGQRGISLLRHGTDEGKVILNIEINSIPIIIERTLERNSKTVSQEKASITINGKIEHLAVSQLKNKILEVLQYPQEFAKKTNLLYRFTVYTPQEEMKQIITEDTETRLSTLRHIFGVDKYKKIKENAGIVTIKFREDIRLIEGQLSILDDLKKRLAEKASMLVDMREKKRDAEGEFEKILTGRKKIEAELKELDKKLKEKIKFEQEIEKANILASGKKEIKTNLNSEIQKIKKEIVELKKIPFTAEMIIEKEREKVDAQKKFDELHKQYTDILSTIKVIESKLKETAQTKDKINALTYCPTCLQDVSHVHKANITNKCEDEIQKKKKEWDELNALIKKKSAEIEVIKAYLMSLDTGISDLRSLKIRVEQLEEKEKRLEISEKQAEAVGKDIEFLEKHIITLKDSVREFFKYETAYRQKELEFKTALKKERESDIVLARIIKETELTIIEIAKVESEISEKEKLKKELAYLAEVNDWLSTTFIELVTLIERQVMLKLRGEFSKLFNEWFSTLVPENLLARLDDDFNPIIEQGEFELDYSFLSGGERTAVALAYRLALNQVVNTMLSKIKTRDIIILDEPTDGFSEQQLDKMRDVLQQLSAEQIIIVSHEQKMESFVDNVIKIKKENRMSRIG